MGVESVFPKTLFTIGGLAIRDTVFQTWIVIGVIVLFALWASKRYRVWEPRPWQLAMEYGLEYMENLVMDLGGRPLPELVPYLTTMMGFITISNLLGLLPMFQAPTRDINTPAALSLVSWGSCQFYGIKKRGVRGYLHSFIEPMVIMLPLNLLGQVSRMLSMALRLFGNILASEIIGKVMFMLLPLLGPLPMNFMGIITGVLQSLVFTVLTLVFIVEAMGEETEESAVGEGAGSSAENR
ncbi:MAG: F0F1 ATP synthase subunit A [Anaerolineae bacterium]|nr:F0F1 ATP synthase subunit A [Anaerolineae bacterium]